MDNIDLKLLTVFDEIYKTGNISQAAENLGTGQPTVSMGLRRLRLHFNDPLFVRTSAGMEPTPLAGDLIRYVRETLGLLHTTLDYRVLFSPATSERAFRLSVSDIAQVVALPKLLRTVKRAAPLVRIDITTVSDSTPKMLESGEIDIAIGFISKLEAGFYQQKLLNEKFVCIADAAHPRIGDKLTLKQFQQEPHLVVSTAGTGYGMFDQILASKKIRRRVGARIPNFTGLTANIENTDYLVTVPERLGKFLQSSEKIKLFPLPFEVPGYLVMQHWHERYAQDPGNRWLRGVIAALF